MAMKTDKEKRRHYEAISAKYHQRELGIHAANVAAGKKRAVSELERRRQNEKKRLEMEALPAAATGGGREEAAPLRGDYGEVSPGPPGPAGIAQRRPLCYVQGCTPTMRSPSTHPLTSTPMRKCPVPVGGLTR